MQRRLIAILALAVPVILAMGMPPGWLRPVPALLLGVTTWWAAAGGQGRALASPLFLLSCSCCVLYDLIPVSLPLLPESLWTVGILAWPPYFIGTPAEAMVQGFSCLCLATFVLLLPSLSGEGASEKSEPPVLGWGFRGTCLALALTLAGWYRAAAAFGLLSSPAAPFFAGALPPLMACMALLVVAPRSTNESLPWNPIIFGLCLVVLFAGGLGKEPMLLLVGLLPFILFRPGRIGPRLLVLPALILLVPIAVVGITMARNLIPDSVSLTPRIAAHAAISKIGDRQLESVHCLGRLESEGMAEAGKEAPWYFLSAVIPRALWRDKPNLSTGRSLWERYCGDSRSVSANHSGSLTLLGEPLARAGVPGLATATAFVLALLAAITLYGFRLGRPGYALTVALTPWSVDFDAVFALYWANLAKSGMLIALTIAAASLIPRMKKR